MSRILTFILIIISSVGLSQQSRYWITTTSGVWSDANNWSATLNGSPGGGIPREGETIIFSGSDKASCTVDIDIDVHKLETTDGYQGAIFFSTNYVTIGAGGLAHNSGIVDAQEAEVSILGDLSLSSLFISTTGVLTLKGNMLLSSEDDFDPVQGSVSIETNGSTTLSGKPQFYTLEIYGTAGITNTITTTEGSRVFHEVKIDPGSGPIKLDGGLISIGGNLEMGNNWLPGTAEIEFNGLGNQYIIGEGISPIIFSTLAINKLDGNLLTANDLSVTTKLQLTRGHLLIRESNSIEIGNDASVLGGAIISHVEGAMTKVGTTDFIFPLGSKGIYGPVSISNLSGFTTVSCRYLKSNLPYQSGMDQSVAVYDNCAFWNMTTNNSETMDISFYPSIYSSCLKMRNVGDYEVLKLDAADWVIENTSVMGETVAITTQTPNNNYALGSLTLDKCVDGPIYWVGTSSSSWNEALNWSKSSGGLGGYGIPCTDNVAIFDGNGNVDCDLNGDVTITQMLILPAYTSEINSNGNTLKVIELFK